MKEHKGCWKLRASHSVTLQVWSSNLCITLTAGFKDHCDKGDYSGNFKLLIIINWWSELKEKILKGLSRLYVQTGRRVVIVGHLFCFPCKKKKKMVKAVRATVSMGPIPFLLLLLGISLSLHVFSFSQQNRHFSKAYYGKVTMWNLLFNFFWFGYLCHHKLLVLKKKRWPISWVKILCLDPSGSILKGHYLPGGTPKAGKGPTNSALYTKKVLMRTRRHSRLKFRNTAVKPTPGSMTSQTPFIYRKSVADGTILRVTDEDQPTKLLADSTCKKKKEKKKE